LTTINGGTLDVSGSLNTSGITYNGGTGAKGIVRSAEALGTGAITFATGANTPRLEIKIDGGGTIALPNFIAGNSGITSTIDVDNNGSGNDGVIQLNGLTSGGMGSSVTLNITGANGYSLYIASIKNTGGGAGPITFNPTTSSLSLGNLWATQGSGTDTWVLDGTALGNFVTGVISNNPAGGAISAVTKQNSSTWTLMGANPYTGATTISGGKLILAGTDGSIAGTSAISLSGYSTLELQGTSLANNIDRLRDGAAISLNNSVLNFSHTGGDADYSEMAGALGYTNSDNTVSASQADVGKTSVVSFASLTRNGNAMINFTGEGLGLTDQNKILFTSMAATPFIGLWATYNTTNSAAYV
jgi:autotransporter-associated beta strand protein